VVDTGGSTPEGPQPMPAPDLVLVSRRVVTPDGERPAAVVVRSGRILEVVDPGEAPAGPVRDVGELAVLPGFVDAHVHVNEPGRTHWEGYDTATRAATCAGVTTLVDMPLNSLPPTTTLAAFEAKRAAAEGQLHVDVALWGGVVPGSEDHLAELHEAGVLGFKAFTCASGVPEYGSFAPAQLEELAARLAALDAPLLVHAEDPDTLDEATSAVLGRGADPRAYATWLEGRPPAAEERAIAAAIEAARATGARLHVLHLSAAAGVAQVSAARAAGVAVTVETCPHYLTLAAEDIPDGATATKCAPPIRDGANREALWAALAAGTIDAVVSDHSPAPADLKHLDDGDFVAAWGGIASLQLGPSLVWTEARRRGHDLADLVRWMSAGPARVAGMTRKGSLTPGAHADLVVFDPDVAWTVDAATLHHRHAVSPYHGRELTGRAVTTYLRGQVVDPTGVPTGRLLRRGAL
jgi:allantoinase